MDDWLIKSEKLCADILKYSLTVAIHNCRSKTIALRVKSVFDDITKLDPKGIDFGDASVMGFYDAIGLF